MREGILWVMRFISELLGSGPWLSVQPRRASSFSYGFGGHPICLPDSGNIYLAQIIQHHVSASCSAGFAASSLTSLLSLSASCQNGPIRKWTLVSFIKAPANRPVSAQLCPTAPWQNQDGRKHWENCGILSYTEWFSSWLEGQGEVASNTETLK